MSIRADQPQRNGRWRYDLHVPIKWIFFCVVFLSLAGCGPKAVMVGVAARNDSDQPVLLWLTKQGPPVEMDWLSPGQFAVVYPPGDSEDDLSALPVYSLDPGETVQFAPRRGRFADGSVPILRIFNGPATLDQLAAVPRRSSQVDTVALGAGDNFVVVRRARPVTARRVPREVFIREEEGP